MNQLKEDIKIALSWYKWVPWEKQRHADVKAFRRLECYMKKDEPEVEQ